MKAAQRIIAAALAFAAALSAHAAGNAKNSGAKPREIIVGAVNAWKPYWYLDGNNKLTGFEKAVLDEIDARHPEFTLRYQVLDFPNILLSATPRLLCIWACARTTSAYARLTT
ncbi:hypothetical protein [Treponema endosymbiont of Eucomonympha sp.]|uniref:hypothetical protein n=1 Tax=Treponema endosymbiont of Eucomonympha sp. TaxID=1580831 RepID=UPI0013969B50|nr:hypothetical protein [Treponema endosymbiont of Eucomonympha sp.]